MRLSSLATIALLFGASTAQVLKAEYGPKSPLFQNRIFQHLAKDQGDQPACLTEKLPVYEYTKKTNNNVPFIWSGWKFSASEDRKHRYHRMSAWVKFVGKMPPMMGHNFGFKVKGTTYNQWQKGMKANEWKYVQVIDDVKNHNHDGGYHLYIFDTMHATTVKIAGMKLEFFDEKPGLEDPCAAKTGHGFEEANDPQCLQTYIKASHACLKHHPDLESKEYAECISVKTFELESCSLQELLDNEDFHKFDVDTTAWLSYEDIQNTQSKLQSLIDATEETTVRTAKIHNDASKPMDYSPLLYETWQNYQTTFEGLMGSVKHELEIAEERAKLQKFVDEKEDAEHRLGDQEELVGAKEVLKDELEKAYKKIVAALAKWNKNKVKWEADEKRLEPAVALKKLRMEKELAELKACTKGAGKASEGFATHSLELMHLIKQRERQPKEDEMKWGYLVDFWKYNFEQFQWPALDNWDYSKTPHMTNFAPLKGQSWLNWPNNGVVRDQFNKMWGYKFDGRYYTLAVHGTIKAPMKGAYKFNVISDDGSFLWLGRQAKTPKTALIKNGGLHGMRNKQFIINLEKGQPMDWTVGFYGNGGGNGLQIQIRDPRNQWVKPMYLAEVDTISEMKVHLPPVWEENPCKPGEKMYWNFNRWHGTNRRTRDYGKCKEMCENEINCEGYLVPHNTGDCHTFVLHDNNRAQFHCSPHGISHFGWWGEIKASANQPIFNCTGRGINRGVYFNAKV